jgi:hypothetical protein
MLKLLYRRFVEEEFMSSKASVLAHIFAWVHLRVGV